MDEVEVVNGISPWVPPPLVAKKDMRSCLGCRDSDVEGKDRVCRHDPPKVFMFMIPVMQAGIPGMRPQQGMQIQSNTQFPVVRDNQWCGKFVPRIEI